MRIIKLAIISFIVLFLVVTGISLFIPSHIRISKAVDIRANKETAMGQIKDVENWKHWYPGADTLQLFIADGKAKGLMKDSLNILLLISGSTDSTVLATTAGSSSRKINMGWNIIPTNDPDKVSVQWYMDFDLSWYPWEKFRSLLFEKIYGVHMEKGLTNLKNHLEK
ncbi:MAG: SRPBCC family protein [Bacteroidota bacterium]